MTQLTQVFTRTNCRFQFQNLNVTKNKKMNFEPVKLRASFLETSFYLKMNRQKRMKCLNEDMPNNTVPGR